MKIRRIPEDQSKRDSYLRVGDTEAISLKDVQAMRNGNLPHWGRWVHYEFPTENGVFSEDDKKLYVFFCVGFLIYYDQILRNACEEHDIYFDWNPRDLSEDKTIHLHIYINPPPRIQKVEQKLYPKVPNLDPQGMLLADYGFTSDPPQPPPPPPPIM